MQLSRYNIPFQFKDKNKNVIINPVYGKFVVVSNETYDRIEANDIGQLLTDDYLRCQNIIVDDEPDIAIPPPGKARHDFFIFLTFDCNLRCTYCFQHDSSYTRNQLYLDEAHVDNCFDFMADVAKGTEAPNIILFGGEPLLDSRTVGLIRYIHEKNKAFKASMTMVTIGSEK